MFCSYIMRTNKNALLEQAGHFHYFEQSICIFINESIADRFENNFDIE